VTSGGKFYPVPGGMLETAENLRREFSIPRQDQDEFAANSHAKAVRAQTDGLFDDEIVPVTFRTRKGEQTSARDEHPRPETTVESLSQLRAVYGEIRPGGDRHGGQHQRSERRCGRMHRDDPRESRCAGAEAARPPGDMGSRGRRAPPDGIRAGPWRGRSAAPN